MAFGKLKFTGLLTLLATTTVGNEAIERAARFFLLNPMVKESYLVVITPSTRYAIAARFNVVPFNGRAFLNKEITIVEGSFAEELLTLEESTALLEKFRAFDWSARPMEARESSLVGSMPPAPRISFRARVDGTYREIEADATLVPALADLVGVILTKKSGAGKVSESSSPEAARPR